MATLEDGSTRTQGISCSNYEVIEREGVTLITTYQDFNSISGVDRSVSKHENDFDHCFVENNAGKTVDRYSAYD